MAAPTGLAAYIINGVTVHRLFQLPIEHEGKTAGYWSLPKASQKVMRTNLRSLKLLIIDEVSMLSNLNLAYIHLRLEEIFGESSTWFGATNVLFVGDILQLPPVNGLPVFAPLQNKDIANRLGCLTSINIWKDTVVYDELTINERQKGDTKFTNILAEIRCGYPSEDTLQCLRERVIKGTISDKCEELSKSHSIPICLFPTRKACEQHNMEMLNKLDTEIHKIHSIDEIDETMGTRKWNKRSAEQLQKLNKDCNLTAGLEAELLIAAGARVMLRRNIDTKQGLVNGAIGTVVNITSQCVVVKFDHITELCNIEMVRSKFMLMKCFHVYRKQFPLILAYAVTIHKCQGLSLDCAIVDLSNKVFCAGMAYVALSRVRSLDGLYLTDFDPASIIVSNACLQEANRLRSLYRKDLPCYNIPKKCTKKAKKRKFECIIDGTEEKSEAKRPACFKCITGKKRSKSVTNKASTKPKKSKKSNDCKLTNAVGVGATSYPKRKFECIIDGTEEKSEAKRPACIKCITGTKRSKSVTNKASTKPKNSKTSNDCELTNAVGVGVTSYPNFRYYQIDECWQLQTCARLGLQFVKKFVCSVGSADTVLTRPNLRGLKQISGDGNCLFRAISFIITGSEEQYFILRSVVISYMISMSHLLVGRRSDGHRNYVDALTTTDHSSIEQYIQETAMNRDGTWGSSIEIVTLSHLLAAPIYVYDVRVS